MKLKFISTNYWLKKKKIFQELPAEADYFSTSNGRVYIDVRDSRGYMEELGKLKRDYNSLVFVLVSK